MTFFLTFLSLYIFTIWKCIAYSRFCRDGIYFDKILVSEYKLFKRSNKANPLIALVQLPVSQMKMTFQEIRIIATGPCIMNQLRDVNTICRRSWYIAAPVWKIYDFKMNQNLEGSIYRRYSIKIAHFVQICLQTWPS